MTTSCHIEYVVLTPTQWIQNLQYDSILLRNWFVSWLFLYLGYFCHSIFINLLLMCKILIVENKVSFTLRLFYYELTIRLVFVRDKTIAYNNQFPITYLWFISRITFYKINTIKTSNSFRLKITDKKTQDIFHFHTNSNITVWVVSSF